MARSTMAEHRPSAPLRLGTWKHELQPAPSVASLDERRPPLGLGTDGDTGGNLLSPGLQWATVQQQWRLPALIALTIDLAPVNHLEGDLEGAI